MSNVINFKEKQKEHNERVLEKMRDGDNLATSSIEDTWFPSRGVFDRALGRMVPAKNDDTPPSRPTKKCHLHLVTT